MIELMFLCKNKFRRIWYRNVYIYIYIIIHHILFRSITNLQCSATHKILQAGIETLRQSDILHLIYRQSHYKKTFIFKCTLLATAKLN